MYSVRIERMDGPCWDVVAHRRAMKELTARLQKTK